VASAFRRNESEVLVTRGYGALSQLVQVDADGGRTIELSQGERIELRLPRGFDTAYQLGPNDERRALPIGSTWDRDGSIFFWQPAPAFLGRYRIVFTNGRERISVRVIVAP